MAAVSREADGCKNLSENKKSKTQHIPDDVVEMIISYLPLGEVGRLAILAKRFRHSWKLCRDLSFDFDFGRGMTPDSFQAVVTDILLHHHAALSADRFRLFCDASAGETLVRRWIEKAVAGLGARDLELDFSPTPQPFTLAYELVAAASVRAMKLAHCELSITADSKARGALQSLRELTLQSVRATPVLIHVIFTDCIEIESLKLVDCNHLFHFKVYAQFVRRFRVLVIKDCAHVYSVTLNAPKLETFHYHGPVTDIHVRSRLPRLNDVVLEFPHPRGFQHISRHEETFLALSGVRILNVTTIFLEGLFFKCGVQMQPRLEYSMPKLKEFQLFVAPESYINPADIVIFLSKCPCIERVFIELGRNAFNNVNSHHWQLMGKKYLSGFNAVFPSLLYVKIKGFTPREMPMIMGRTILKFASSMSHLVIVKVKNDRASHAMIENCLCQGITSQALIQVYDYMGDDGVTISTI